MENKMPGFARWLKGHKKVVLLCTLLTILIITVFSSALHEGKETFAREVTSYEAQPALYTEQVRKQGIVQSREEKVIAIDEGQKILVQRGQEVKKDEKIAEKGSESGKDVHTDVSGIVTDVQDDSVTLATGAKIVSFMVNRDERSHLRKDQELTCAEETARISFISASADPVQGAFSVQATLKNDTGLALGEQVDVTIPLGEPQEVWKIPLNCVVRKEGKDYVFFPPIVDHITDIQPDDYAEITILGSEEDMYLVKPLTHNKVLILSDFSRQYLQKALEKL